MMKNLKKLLVLFVIASVESRVPKRISPPDITIIPTGVVPNICVTARRELPPCGVGQYMKIQREYEDKIEKIRQSYVDMVIDFKDTKDVSFENYGPGRIYLESFESLDRQMQEENETKKGEGEKQKLANGNKLKNRVSKVEDHQIRIIRVIRSLDKTVITASECIPLGVEFCDDFPRPDVNLDVNQDEKNSRIQKRSLPPIQDNLNRLDNEEVLRVVKLPKIFIKEPMKKVNESQRLPSSMFSDHGKLSKRMKFHDFMAEIIRRFKAKRYKEEEELRN